MIVQELMTQNPISAQSTSSVYEVMRTMLDEGIRHMPIVEGRNLIGIISDRDLRGFSLSLLDEPARAQERLKARITSIMSSDVITVDGETDVGDLIDTLLDNHIGAVPVIDPEEGDLVGIVSYVDVLRALRPLASEA